MADDAVARARALVGTRFRLHGRGGEGLDCVGLVACAYGAETVPSGYALRTADPQVIERELLRAGFRPVISPLQHLLEGPGVALLCPPGSRNEGEGATPNPSSKCWRGVSEAQPGDIVILNAGPAQLHLGIWTGGGLIHADAALRKVVETPGAPRWPVIGIWKPE